MLLFISDGRSFILTLFFRFILIFFLVYIRFIILEKKDINHIFRLLQTSFELNE